MSERLRDTLVDDFGVPAERVEIVTNGADTELFAPRDRAAALAELGLDPADELVLFVGLLAWWNDFPTVTEAFAEVVSRRPRALLVFVGDGDERAAIERLVGTHRIAERVRFAGFVSDRSLVATYVAAARVCLSPGSSAARDRPADETRRVSGRRTGSRRLGDPRDQPSCWLRPEAASPSRLTTPRPWPLLSAASSTIPSPPTRSVWLHARRSSRTIRGGRSPAAWRRSSSSRPPRRA